MLGLVFMLFPYFIYVAHTTKFTRGKIFRENQNRKKVLVQEKKKKSIEERKKGRKSTILSRKEKKYLFESDW